jgi:hypothetical protein
MKQKLLVGLLLCVVFACTKQNDTTPPVTNQQKSVLKISVADFIQKVKPMLATSARESSSSSTARDSSLTGISDIYYFLFSQDGQVVSYRHQTSTESNFGTISDSIPAGTYWATVAASPAQIDVYPSEGLFSIPTVDNTISGAFPDIFYSRQLVTIGQEPISVSMPTLERIMSRLEVNIPDMISSDSVSIAVRYENAAIKLFTGTSVDGFAFGGGLSVTQRSVGVFSDLVAKNSTGGSRITLNIIYRERSTQNMKTKSVDVYMYTNRTTVVSGKLFQPIVEPGRVNGDFTITVNKEWNNNPNVVDF